MEKYVTWNWNTQLEMHQINVKTQDSYILSNWKYLDNQGCALFNSASHNPISDLDRILVGL